MSLDDELQRLMDLEHAVRNYLSHLWAHEQGAEYDAHLVEVWRDEMHRLTEDESLWKDGVWNARAQITLGEGRWTNE